MAEVHLVAGDIARFDGAEFIWLNRNWMRWGTATEVTVARYHGEQLRDLTHPLLWRLLGRGGGSTRHISSVHASWKEVPLETPAS